VVLPAPRKPVMTVTGMGLVELMDGGIRWMTIAADATELRERVCRLDGERLFDYGE
jgi:hypothetical protein